jgi:hypothetical protein
MLINVLNTMLYMKLKLILSGVFIVCSLYSSIGQKLNTDSLKVLLDSVWITDQGYRFKQMELQKKGETESEEYKKLILAIKKTDTINIKIITTIIDKYGWLGAEVIGDQGNQVLFTVIQHANLATQEKYLPIIREAAKEGKTLTSNLAILEDRIALRQGKKQIYGSQVWLDTKTGNIYVQPMEDPENVDKRRIEVGLPIMDEYLQQSFQIKWNIEEYKKNLPIVEELIKNKKK